MPLTKAQTLIPYKHKKSWGRNTERERERERERELELNKIDIQQTEWICTGNWVYIQTRA